jgi:hypothetical protein
MQSNTKLLAPEYMRIHIKNLIPKEIEEEYNTDEFMDENGFVYMEVTGAIYGLEQSIRISSKSGSHQELKQIWIPPG